MRAVVLTDFGATAGPADVAIPEPGAGEVRVRVHASSINGFDVAVANSYLNGMMEHRFRSYSVRTLPARSTPSLRM